MAAFKEKWIPGQEVRFWGVCLKMGFCIKEKVLGPERGKGPQGTGTNRGGEGFL